MNGRTRTRKCRTVSAIAELKRQEKNKYRDRNTEIQKYIEG